MKKKDNNRTLKLLALLIAIVLWFYVGVEQDPLSHRTYDVPLEIQNLAVDKSASLAQDTVNVRVTGRQDRLNDLSASDFEAYVDLTDAETGDNRVRVQVKLPNGVYFAKLDPETVDVLVTDRQGQNMDVEVVSSGQAPEGITIDDISVEPATVFVSGDPSEIAQVARVGVAVDLSSVLDDSETEMAVSFFDAEGNVLSDTELEASPDEVTVSIKVSRSDGSKLVPVQANLVGELPDGYQIDSVDVSPASVTVSGAADVLAGISEVRTEAIDLSALTTTTQQTLAVVSDATVEPASVTVTVNISPAQTDEDTSGQSSARMLPVAVSGQGASGVTLDTQIVEVSYHMLPGYSDAGDSLSAYVVVDAVPSAATTAQVQVNAAEGMVIDSISPSTVTLTPIASGSEGDQTATGY